MCHHQTGRQNHNINVTNKFFKNITEFKYMKTDQATVHSVPYLKQTKYEECLLLC
jgi:hypothetical protein